MKRPNKKILSEKEKLKRATFIQSNAYKQGVEMATKALIFKPNQVSWENEFDNQFADFYDIREPDEFNPDAGSETLHYKALIDFMSKAIKQSNLALLKKVASTIEGQRIHLNTVEETSEFARGYNYGTERANGFFKKTLLKLEEMKKEI